MPPKRVLVEKAGPPAPRRGPPKSYAQTAYHALTSPDNASVVKAVGIFGVCLALSVQFLEAWDGLGKWRDGYLGEECFGWEGGGGDEWMDEVTNANT